MTLDAKHSSPKSEVEVVINGSPGESKLEDMDQSSDVEEGSVKSDIKIEITSDDNGVNISTEDKEMITNLFQYFDADESGSMSTAELGNFMRAMGKIIIDPKHTLKVEFQECFLLMMRLRIFCFTWIRTKVERWIFLSFSSKWQIRSIFSQIMKGTSQTYIPDPNT